MLPVAQVAVDVVAAAPGPAVRVPRAESLAETATVGCRVRVRFAGRLTSGFLLQRTAESEHQGRLGYLERVVSPEPVLTPEIAGLARAVADRYGGTLADVLRLAIPPRHAAAEAGSPRWCPAGPASRPPRCHRTSAAPRHRPRPPPGTGGPPDPAHPGARTDRPGPAGPGPGLPDPVPGRQARRPPGRALRRAGPHGQRGRRGGRAGGRRSGRRDTGQDHEISRRGRGCPIHGAAPCFGRGGRGPPSGVRARHRGSA